MSTTSLRVDLKEKVAVVTGGSGVLGSAMCRALAGCGAKVAVLGRDRDKAEKLAAELERNGGVARGISCDVLDRGSLESAAAATLKALGPCDILVNGAGGNHPKGTAGQEYFDPKPAADGQPSETSFFDLDVTGFKFVFDLNLLGTVLPSQVFGKQMLGRPGCAIINVSSMSSIRPLTKVAAYSAAKAAVNNITQWLATHFAQAGIRVNAIAPGFFITEQNRRLMVQEDGTYSARAKKVVAQTPMRRFGEPEELVGALLWLADSRSSGFVTGTIIPIDGGFAAYAGV
ncbi:MAG: SDR family oxidoreductase [Myxococcota bacterium]|nr:SDR family oxidoreductase [Myxococcota bacterium]